MKKHHLPALKPVDLAVVLAALYFVILAVVPFEAIDRSLARLVFHYGQEGWSTAWLWAGPLYRGAKLFTGALLAVVILFAVRAYRADDKPAADALIRVILAAAVSLGVMLLLKHTAGVACPWNLPEFSQKTSQVITPFAWLFSDAAPQGKCWPAGHASTGFCLFGLYFAARRLHSKLSALVFAAVLLFGSLCATGRMLQGAHFLSHSVASLLLEFAVAGLIFWPDSKEKTEMSVTQGALFCAVSLTLLALPFFASIAQTATLRSFTASLAALLLFALVWTGVFLLIVQFCPRLWRWLLVLLAVIGGGADAFTTLYGTVMTPDMVRNALATDWREASELLSLRWLLRSVLFALPALAIALFAPRVTVQTAPDFRGKLLYATKGAAAFIFTASFLLSQFSTLSAFMRNQKEARYLIEPAAVIYSFVRTLISDGKPSQRERAVIDPAPVLAPANSAKPLLVVLVVGETVRADNWGLNGYDRNTTPELARRGVINFTDVTACGTSTDVSLPCMFSRVGRNHYDRDRILSEESILSVIERAGVTVRWADNQSGCKGACTDGMTIPVIRNNEDCPQGGDCLDGAMLGNVRRALQSPAARELLVLHSMGNHGPAYWKRAPASFRPFGDGCRKNDLGECSREAVVASYDNAVAYTDRFLAEAIDLLAADTTRDTVLLYLSDHGESLGEKSLWLHGAPYWMKLREQTKVPMILWMNDSARERFSLPPAAGNVNTPVTHDNLADTLLELTGVASPLFHAGDSLLSLLRKG